MSTQKRFIPETEAREILERGFAGVLSTTSPDGRPYGVPVNYCYSGEENCVFFHCAKEGRKIGNILLNPQVSFLVVGPYEVLPEKITTRYESVMVSGTAAIVSGPDEKAEKLRALCAKFAPDSPWARDGSLPCDDSLIVKIAIECVTGKRNPG